MTGLDQGDRFANGGQDETADPTQDRPCVRQMRSVQRHHQPSKDGGMTFEKLRSAPPPDPPLRQVVDLRQKDQAVEKIQPNEGKFAGAAILAGLAGLGEAEVQDVRLEVVDADLPFVERISRQRIIIAKRERKHADPKRAMESEKVIERDPHVRLCLELVVEDDVVGNGYVLGRQLFRQLDKQILIAMRPVEYSERPLRCALQADLELPQ